MLFKLTQDEGLPSEQVSYIDLDRWGQLLAMLKQNPNVDKWIDVHYRGKQIGVIMLRFSLFLILSSFHPDSWDWHGFFEPGDRLVESELPPGGECTNPYLEIL